MGVTLGIVCAVGAMLFWGFGDFMIQRSTRRFGDWETIWVISVIGVIALAPFALTDTWQVIEQGGKDLLIVIVASVVLFVAALLEFEALKRGKLSVVEPLWSSEIIASALLAFLVLGERLSLLQIGIIILLIAGLFLVSLKNVLAARHLFSLERAAKLAVVSALVMGGANFLFGVSSRVTDPFVTNFFISLVLALFSTLFLISRGKIGKLIKDLVRSPRMLITMALLDNGAWVAFGFGMSLAPIAIAVALSESYIIIGVLLGIFINKEPLHRHQKVGLIVAILSAIALAIATI